MAPAAECAPRSIMPRVEISEATAPAIMAERIRLFIIMICLR
jgi:hypothetical protein